MCSFWIAWNSTASDEDVQEMPNTHFYKSSPSLPGVWRVYATYKGQEREVAVRPVKDYQTEALYYLDFEEPELPLIADSCISVSSKVDGAHVLIEVDDA